MTKKKNMNFSFKDIFKTTLFFRMSDTIISFIIFMFVLLAVIGYYLRKTAIKEEQEKNLNSNNQNSNNQNINNQNSNNQNSNSNKNNRNIKKIIGTVMFVFFGLISTILLLPIILNFLTYFLVDYAISEAFE